MKFHIVAAVITVLIATLLCDLTVAREPTAAVAPGSSYATAIRVPAANERDGIRYERSYLASHYHGARFVGQRLGNHARHIYDIMTIVTAGGKQQDIYFDITSYFGRF